MNPTLKRYLASSAVTFLSVFLLTLGASFTTETVESSLSFSAIGGLIGVAVRAAVKAVLEGAGLRG